MKGLYVKDLMSVWQSKWILFLISILVGGFLVYFQGTFEDSPTMLGFIAFFCVMLSMQGISTILTDRISGWNLYQTTFPISRKKAVEEKYVLSFGLGLFGLLFGLGLAYLFTHFIFQHLDVSQESWWINICIAFIIWPSSMAVAIPLCLILSKNQYFFALLASFILPTFLIIWWSQNITVEQVNNVMVVNMNMNLLFGMALGCLIFCFISYLVMPSFLAKKDQR